MAFLEAGADILETNTFNGTTISQGDYELDIEEEVGRLPLLLLLPFGLDQLKLRVPGVHLQEAHSGYRAHCATRSAPILCSAMRNRLVS